MHENIERPLFHESGQNRVQSIGIIRSSAILLAEDDVIIRRYLATGLRAAGFEVDDAETGIAAWERFKKGAYDLLITDNDMPGMCGIELFARVRRLDEKIPAIVMSGSTRAAQICEDAGFEGWHFLLKPFTAERLIAAAIDAVMVAKILPDSQRSHTFPATRHEGDSTCVCQGFGI